MLIDDNQNTNNNEHQDDSFVNTVKSNQQTIKSDVIHQTAKSVNQNIISSGISSLVKTSQKKPETYTFNETDYLVISKISDSSTEAEIFLLRKNKKEFVLKLYYPFVKPKIEIVKKLRSLDHPDILTVIDSGFYNGRFFEILPYADQGSLADVLPEKNNERIKLIIKEIVNALRYCHQNGIIHRDIKPTNIFINNEESQNVLLGDFGIASIVDKADELRRTSIFQTPIYAAPEYKISLSGETYITKAVDYYALGITIWELWSGVLPPAEMDDLEFLRLMFEGQPPLPNEMEEDLQTLIKGLTTRDYKKRWGYEEVQKWLNGETVLVHEEKNEEDYPDKFEFSEDSRGQKIFASSPEELASLIYKNQDTGRKLLYRGLISDWLKKSKNRKLFLEVADIVEYQFKDNEKAGTLYSVYLLDKNFPYYSVENKKLRTKKELVKELEEHFEVYCRRLQNPYDIFYLYLLAKKAKNDVETFRLFFEREDEETALHKTIFSLKLSLESRVTLNLAIGKKKITVDNLPSLSKQLTKNPNLSTSLLNNKKFLIWLDLIDNAIYQQYQKTIPSLSNKDASAMLPYLLSPEMGYTGIDGRECQSLPEFGEEFFNHFDEYIEIFKDRTQPIFNYLKFHKMDGEVEFFNQVFDMEKASLKPGPYNDKIALYKIIKGTGYNSWIEVGNMRVNSPDDLMKLDKENSEIIRNNLEDENSQLFAWLSVFFHEYPLNEEENYYIYYLEDYEERLKNFVGFIRKVDPGNKFVIRYDDANDKVSGLRNRFTNIKQKMRMEVLAAYLLPMVLASLLFVYTLVFDNIDLPLNIFSLGNWYFLTFALGLTIFYFWSAFNDSDFSFSAGCIGGPIIGIIISVIAYYIFYFILFTPLLLAVVLGLGYIFVYKRIKSSAYYFMEAGENYKNSLDLTELENIVLAYTFGKVDEVNIDSSEELSLMRSTIREQRFSVWIISLVYCALVLLIITLLIFNTPSIF